MDDTTKKELIKMCESVEKDLRAIVNQERFICIECKAEIDSDDLEENESGETEFKNGRSCACGSKEIEPESMYNYVGGTLDYTYTLNRDGTYRGCRIAVAYGGPAVFINTNTNKIEGYWGFGDGVEIPLSSSIVEQIDDAMCELTATDY